MSVKTKNLKQTAYEYIKQKIINNGLKPGQDVVEEKLQKEIGASRTPVREAIMRLQNENMIKIYPRKGMFVSQITVSMVNNIYQVREIIEPQAVRIAAPHLSKDVLKDFLNKFKKIPATISGNGFQKYLTDLDMALHSYIIKSCQNDYLVKIMENIFDHSQRIRVQSFNIEQRYIKSNKEHIELLEALIKDNIKEAVEITKRHISNSKNVALNIISKND
jgi:GntR family transcriptional regulator, rspAB operon transcriptional repressor